VWDRVAETFKRIELALGRVKRALEPIWLGIAEGIAPALERVLAIINRIDFGKVGEGFRRVFSGDWAGVEGGRLGELFSASFAAAIEWLTTVLERLWAAAIFGKAFGISYKAKPR